MKDAYPELEIQRGFIDKMVRLEEERFGSTMIVGLQKLDELFSQTEGAMPKFKELGRLYDTFGTPRDLIRVALAEHGFEMEEQLFIQDFDKAVREIQLTGTINQSRTGQTSVANEAYGKAQEHCRSEFIGYDSTEVTNAQAVCLIKNGVEVPLLNEGDEGEVILDQTPFYAESGGQVGDVGRLVGSTSGTDVIAIVEDTYSPAQGLIVHKVKVERGIVKVGDTVSAEVDVEKRDATRRNHTATHLLHAALREVLGTHVKQGGSVVAPNYLRFDFSHFKPLTRDEIAEIERLVNYQIIRNEKVITDILSLDEAMQSGAIALFGEKYAEKVRVLTVPGFSKELCGGHTPTLPAILDCLRLPVTNPSPPVHDVFVLSPVWMRSNAFRKLMRSLIRSRVNCARRVWTFLLPLGVFRTTSRRHGAKQTNCD